MPHATEPHAIYASVDVDRLAALDIHNNRTYRIASNALLFPAMLTRYFQGDWTSSFYHWSSIRNSLVTPRNEHTLSQHEMMAACPLNSRRATKAITSYS